MNDLFNIFFSAECEKIYKPLICIFTRENDRSIAHIEDKKKPKIAVALGQVVQLCIHFSRALNINIKNQMIYYGNKSYIHSYESIDSGAREKVKSGPYNLFFLGQSSDNANLETSLILLEENMRLILKALKNLKEKEDIGYQQQSNNQDIAYPNTIIQVLHEIADFQ